MTVTESTSENTPATVELPFFLVGPVMILGSFSILLYQGVKWLYRGHWTPLSMKIITDYIAPDSYFLWLADSSQWAGLKKVLTYATCDMSMFGFFFWFGVILILLIRD